MRSSEKWRVSNSLGKQMRQLQVSCTPDPCNSITNNSKPLSSVVAQLQWSHLSPFWKCPWLLPIDFLFLIVSVSGE